MCHPFDLNPELEREIAEAVANPQRTPCMTCGHIGVKPGTMMCQECIDRPYGTVGGPATEEESMVRGARMMIQPTNHADCPRLLRAESAALGVEITVSTEPPLVAGPYTVPAFTCPHGSPYWIEPTGEQIVTWAEEGTS